MFLCQSAQLQMNIPSVRWGQLVLRFQLNTSMFALAGA